MDHAVGGPYPARRPRAARPLDYLGRYVFRNAIANSRLEAITDDDVTFRYRDNRTQDI